MSSSTNPKPVFRQTRGSKAAIIRPVNRRDGKQTFVRIDDAETGIRPSARALQLDDYVAQIRSANSKKPVAQTNRPETEGQDTSKVGALDLRQSLAKTVAKQQQQTNDQLTQADHVKVLQAVAKLDAGYQWIAESNRVAAAESNSIAEQIAQASVQPEAPQTTTQPISQDLVNNIAAAIASVLTNVSESELEQRIEGNSQAGAPAVAPTVAPTIPQDNSQDDETLRLSPELPRPEYTLPVTEHSLGLTPKVAASTPASAPASPKPTHSVSLTAAAWDVPAFRWPQVTGQILATDGIINTLADNCQSILAPFGKTIAVSAPTRGQGTTTMSITLARMFAATGKRVLIIDADIMNPSLSKMIGIEGVSWHAGEKSNGPVGESVVHGRKSGICVMPLSGPIADVEPYSAPIFDQLEAQVDKVRGEFDLIVIDCGPVWQLVDEISSSSHLVDVAMLVNQDTYSNGFAEARERMMDRGIFKFIAAQNSFAKRAG